MVAVISWPDLDGSGYFWPVTWPGNGRTAGRLKHHLLCGFPHQGAGRPAAQVLTQEASLISPRYPSVGVCSLGESEWIHTLQITETTRYSRGFTVQRQHCQKKLRSRYHICLVHSEQINKGIDRETESIRTQTAATTTQEVLGGRRRRSGITLVPAPSEARGRWLIHHPSSLLKLVPNYNVGLLDL